MYIQLTSRSFGHLMSRLTGLCLAVAITGAVFAVPARAAEGTPASFMQALATDALAVLSDETLDQNSRSRAFRQILRSRFDLPTISRFVLGRYWGRADAEEQEEFVQLFEDYLVAVYGRRLGHYVNHGLQFTGQRLSGANGDIEGAVVHSRIDLGNGPGVKLDWRLIRHEDGWQVIDILVEGVSLAMAQRSEFASVIRGGGGRVSGLLGKLRKKTQMLAMN